MITALVTTGIDTTAIEVHIYEYFLPNRLISHYTVPVLESLPLAALVGEESRVNRPDSADDLASSTLQMPNTGDTLMRMMTISSRMVSAAAPTSRPGWRVV
ncbi:hypothetical protein [Mycobacterium lepromatosis]|uniref:hypothetical protein n=1 Tax=Mycobacterium lepromatosis TaxID=480418 RepID=UPI000B1E8011|nr:hypothetical protein [Mycobacterium lepromatosis]